MMSDDAQPVNLFRIEGEYWTIAFDGRVFRLRDTKGLRYVAHLLAHPATRVGAVALVAAAGSKLGTEHDVSHDENSDAGGERERARVTVSKGIKAALQRIGASHPALAEHLEVTIKRGYVCSYNPDPRVRIAWDV